MPDDPQWFMQEVHVHEDQLRVYLRRSFPSVRDVDDIVQESFLRILRRHSAEPIRSARAFLFAIARRLAIDWVRDAQAAPIGGGKDVDALPVVDERSGRTELARAELLAHLAAAIDALPPRCRDVVVLRKLRRRSARETARQLGLKEASVEMHLLRGNARIRAYLAARGITHVLES